MASRLNPYLAFDGRAREALEFYRDVLGGTLTTTTYAEGGMEHDPADANKIMHGQIENDSGYTIMASDAPSGTPAEPMSNVVDVLVRQLRRKLGGRGPLGDAVNVESKVAHRCLARDCTRSHA